MNEILAENSGAATQVLFVEDDASDEFLIRRALEKDFPGFFKVTHARSESEALSMLAAQAFDVCLLDLSLPDSSGFGALQHIVQRVPGLPVLILTGNNSEATGRAAVSVGAQDYILKDKTQSAELRQHINYAIARKQRQDDLVKRANYDELTGLLRPEPFRACLETALARAKRTRRSLALYFADLDGFKEINDTHGHEAGDQLLKIVAERMKECLRAYDVAARMGGDEFAVLVEDMVSPGDSAYMAERLQQAMQQPLAVGPVSLPVGMSIGIATTFSGAAVNIEELLKQADMAMYQAKAEGGGRYCVYSGTLQEKTHQRQQRASELREALIKNQFRIFYQPRISASTGKIIGAEALLRWNHPKEGILTPEHFLEAAAEGGITEELDLWVLQAVCTDLKAWEEKNMGGFAVAVNLSWKTLESPYFTGRMEEILHGANLAPGSLVAEICEASLTSAPEILAARLRALCDMGLLLRLDHFGKGQASMRLLQQMPLTCINIDRSLLVNIKISANSNSLVRAMIDTAHSLNLKTAAVGIESVEQRDMLMQNHCDELQGFFFCPPLQASGFEQAMRLNRAA